MAKSIRQGLSAALGIGRDIVGGTKDYMRENRAVHKEALESTGHEQRAMVENIHRNAGNAPTPMGTNEFYGKAEMKAKKLKQERGISLKSSIAKRLKNPND